MKKWIVYYILIKLYPIRVDQEEKKGVFICKVFVGAFNIMSFTTTDPDKSVNNIELFLQEALHKASIYGNMKYKADYKFIIPALIRSFLVSFS